MHFSPSCLVSLRAAALLSCALSTFASAAQADAVKDAAAPALAVTAATTTSASPVAAPQPAPAASATAAPPVRISETFGVEVQGARLSASGYVVDLRYRVLDADKAKPLLDRKVRPVLIDEATGNRFYVPQPPIVGALRQTSRNNPVALGKTYFMIFANPDQRLKTGDTIALYLGEQRFGNLRIEP